eukprot:2649403-Rhodomonas_salina.2
MFGRSKLEAEVVPIQFLQPVRGVACKRKLVTTVVLVCLVQGWESSVICPHQLPTSFWQKQSHDWVAFITRPARIVLSHESLAASPCLSVST